MVMPKIGIRFGLASGQGSLPMSRDVIQLPDLRRNWRLPCLLLVFQAVFTQNGSTLSKNAFMGSEL